MLLTLSLSTGVRAVRIGDQKWPVGHHGLCGDNYSLAMPRPHEAGGKHYTGQIGGANKLPFLRLEEMKTTGGGWVQVHAFGVQ